MTKEELLKIAPNSDLVTEKQLDDTWEKLHTMWSYYNDKYVFVGERIEHAPTEVREIMDALNTACIACHALQNIKEVVDHA